MNISALAIAAGLGLALASPATAANDVVSRYAQWEHHLRERVNDLLVYPLGAGNVSGDVLVGFRIGRNGKPADIVVRRTSGQPIFDRAAIMLVSRLGRIGAAPSNDTPAEIHLKISYGDPSLTAAQSMALERADLAEQRKNEQRNRALISGATHLAQRP